MSEKKCGFCLPAEQDKHGEVKKEWSQEWRMFIPLCRIHSIEKIAEEMTLEQFKEELPDVTVKIGKKLILPAMVAGRKEQFAAVMWKNNGVFVTSRVAWETVLHCYNTGTSITV